MLHPMMPFLTEELWEKVFGNTDMLITSSWPEITTGGNDEAAAEIGFIVDLITAIRSIRSEMNVPVSAKPELVLVTSDSHVSKRIDGNLPSLLRLARIEAVRFAESLPEQSAQGVVDGIGFALPLAGILDFDAERARLDKEIKAVEQEKRKLEGKLGNPGFMSKAPEDVIEENRRRLAEENDTLKRLSLARERLG